MPLAGAQYTSNAAQLLLRSSFSPISRDFLVALKSVDGERIPIASRRVSPLFKKRRFEEARVALDAFGFCEAKHLLSALERCNCDSIAAGALMKGSEFVSLCEHAFVITGSRTESAKLLRGAGANAVQTAWALNYIGSAGDAAVARELSSAGFGVLEISDALATVRGLCPSRIARALYAARFGFTDIALALHKGMGVPFSEVAHILFKGCRAAPPEIAKALHAKHGADATHLQTLVAVKDGTSAPLKQIALAALAICSDIERADTLIFDMLVIVTNAPSDEISAALESARNEAMPGETVLNLNAPKIAVLLLSSRPVKDPGLSKSESPAGSDISQQSGIGASL